MPFPLSAALAWSSSSSVLAVTLALAPRPPAGCLGVELGAAGGAGLSVLASLAAGLLLAAASVSGSSACCVASSLGAGACEQIQPSELAAA